MTPALTLLLCVAGLGALDTLVHHEWQAHLPTRQGAALELRLHAARDFAYTFLFATMGWLRPGGIWAWVLAALLATEIVITLLDFLEEDRHRPLPPTERVLHSVITIVYGAFLATLAPTWLGWLSEPTGLAVERRGVFAWIFGAAVVGVAASGVRDLLAARKLDRGATG